MVVAIVGASGAVGQELLRILEQRAFPVTELRLFGSQRSEGRPYCFAGSEIPVTRLQHGDQFRGVDIAFVSAGGAVSRDYADDITRFGAVMIDNSSAFRMDEQVPLIVPEINACDIPLALGAQGKRIIANPNCTTIIMSVCLNAIHALSPILRVHVATYQSASGAGARAMAELEQQYRQVLAQQPVTTQRFPYQLAYNLIPQIDVFSDDDYTKEELKMYNETRKIMHADIAVSSTCVRVPSLRAHSEAVWLETKQPVSVQAVKQAISHAPGCSLMDDIQMTGEAAYPYPMPLFLSGTDDVFVGRVRRDLANPNGITFWCVGDQIRKGAALNAIQIAEKLNQGA